MLTLLLAAVTLASALPSPAADLGGRDRAVDPVKAKEREAERQRLLAKLRDEAPKTEEVRTLRDPLEAPIFHRYDRR